MKAPSPVTVVQQAQQLMPPIPLDHTSSSIQHPAPQQHRMHLASIPQNVVNLTNGGAHSPGPAQHLPAMSPPMHVPIQRSHHHSQQQAHHHHHQQQQQQMQGQHVPMEHAMAASAVSTSQSRGMMDRPFHGAYLRYNSMTRCTPLSLLLTALLG